MMAVKFKKMKKHYLTWVGVRINVHILIMATLFYNCTQPSQEVDYQRDFFIYLNDSVVNHILQNRWQFSGYIVSKKGYNIKKNRELVQIDSEKIYNLNSVDGFVYENRVNRGYFFIDTTIFANRYCIDFFFYKQDTLFHGPFALSYWNKNMIHLNQIRTYGSNENEKYELKLLLKRLPEKDSIDRLK